MKKLILMRHAKSSFKQKKEDDRDRPLSKRGRRDAADTGNLLVEKKLVPQIIISSAAARARQTTDLLIEKMDFHGDACYLNRLFMAEVDIYMAELQNLPDEYDSVLVVGHNPSVECLLQILTGKIQAMPTGCVACLQIPIDSWKEIPQQDSSELVEFWRPKDL